MPKDNLIGMRYGRLEVVSKAARKSTWLCRCDCGTEKEIRSDSLKNGVTSSCGCFSREMNVIHGESYNSAYSIWSQMKARCHDKNNPNYHRYGARGIYVCDAWMKDIKRFLADMGERPKDASIERIDNDGPYCKENCRWATKQEQANNRRTNRILTLNGEEKTLIEWARAKGIRRETIKSRLEQGWSEHDALTIPPRKGNYHGPTPL